MVSGFITTYAISAYHHPGEVYLIQHYVIKFVSEVTCDRHDISKILLKVAINTIKQPSQPTIY